MMDREISTWTHDIHQGDVVETLEAMPASSVHCVVTSPPYYGLRDYGEDVESIFSGDPDCEHDWSVEQMPAQGGENTDDNPPNTGADETTQESRIRGGDGIESDRCRVCGAWRGQLGLEPTLDQFVSNLVTIGEALHRVLREDGSWWLNLGDSFAGSWGAQSKNETENNLTQHDHPDKNPARNGVLRRKNKMLVPHRVAIALQDAGWVVRSDAVWAKPNPMPHPVKDRLHEHKEFLFHLTPEPDYWFDLDAIREPHKAASFDRAEKNYHTSAIGMEHTPRDIKPEHVRMNKEDALHPNGKNPGDVFEVSVKPFADAHFAVYPPELCEPPIKASCPPEVCADCGTPYERRHEETYLWERDVEAISRPQSRRALERFEDSDLTVEHLEAARTVGFGDGDHGDASQGSRDRVDDRTRQLADEAKEVLGGYFREFVASPERDPTGWEQTCGCETDRVDPGIILDPFAGAGTTCLVAKRLGRRFVGIDLNPDYVAMAQKRVGVTVDEPSRIRDNATEHGLEAFLEVSE
jgi:DNA modification methylase